MPQATKNDALSSWPIPVQGLVPQVPPMLLIRELGAREEGWARTELSVPEGKDHLFLDGRGRLDGAALIEMLAQLAAAERGHEMALQDLPIKRGFLVGVQDFEIDGPVRAGERLVLECRRTFEMDQASLVQGSVVREGRSVASGTLKIWLMDELPPRPPASPAGPTGGAWRLPAECGWIAAEGSAVHKALVESVIRLEAGGGCSGEKEAEAPTETVHEADATLFFSEAFPAFRGHFPDYPILPAVVALEIGIVLGRVLTGSPLRLAAVERAKFAQAIYPGQSIRARVSIRPAGENAEQGQADDLRIQVRLERDDRPVVSYTIRARQP